MTKFKFGRSMRLLCAYGVLTVVTCAAGAQGSTNPAPQPTTETTATAQARLALERKAIEILKATFAPLAAAHSIGFRMIP
jgi:hypothetical protein